MTRGQSKHVHHTVNVPFLNDNEHETPVKNTLETMDMTTVVLHYCCILPTAC